MCTGRECFPDRTLAAGGHIQDWLKLTAGPFWSEHIRTSYPHSIPNKTQQTSSMQGSLAPASVLDANEILQQR